MRISASFHHHSRRDNPSGDTARVTIKKTSLNPTAEDHPTPWQATRAERQRSVEHPAR